MIQRHLLVGMEKNCGNGIRRISRIFSLPMGEFSSTEILVRAAALAAQDFAQNEGLTWNTASVEEYDPAKGWMENPEFTTEARKQLGIKP